MAPFFPVPKIEDYRARQPSWNLHGGGKAGTRSDDLVSVVTVTYNSVKTLADTIDSVLKQSHPNIEYILVDGGSSDGTADIIRARQDDIAVWLSEKDAGISDAFNKGVSLANGTYVAIVNADDCLSPDNLRYAVDTLQRSGADFVFGDQQMHGDDGTTFFYKGDPDYGRLIRKRMPALNHPTVVVRRDAYERAGLFILKLRYAMDYELLLRFHLAGMRGVHDPRIQGHMALSGASDKNYMKGLAECREISRFHGLPASQAWLEYAYSVAKGRTRRALAGILPKAVVSKVWALVNRQYAAK